MTLRVPGQQWIRDVDVEDFDSRVRGFPTVILFRQGEEQGRFSGAQPAPRVRRFVEQLGGM